MADDKIEFVYLGRRMLKGNKKGVAVITETLLSELMTKYSNESDIPMWGGLSWEIEHAASYFASNKALGATIGGIYTAAGSIDVNNRVTSLAVKGVSWAGKQTEYEQLIGAWVSYDNGVTDEQNMKAAENRAAKNTRLARAVDVIREQYKNVPAGQRRGFQFWLLDQISKR